MQSSALAAVLAAVHFPGQPMVVAACIMSACTHATVGSALAGFWNATGVLLLRLHDCQPCSILQGVQIPAAHHLQLPCMLTPSVAFSCGPIFIDVTFRSQLSYHVYKQLLATCAFLCTL
jgi:hypothetical protein